MANRKSAWVVAIAAIVLGGRVGNTEPIQIAAPLVWTEGSFVGSSLFQGKIDGDAVSGRIFAGDEQILVSATLTSSTSIVGNLSAPSGGVVGSFTGTLDGEWRFYGTYTVTGETTSEAWTAPAEELPGGS